MTQPIIFLDFDGVLNSVASRLAYGNGRQFCPTALALMDRLATAAHAHVVVSSAWRVGNAVADLRAILERAGSTSTASRIVDVTPRLGTTRGAEIAAWLAANPEHAGFVIVDDQNDMLDGQLPHFVQTCRRDGFGVREYVQALAIIAPQHTDVMQLAWWADGRPLQGPDSPLLVWEEAAL